MVNCFFFSLLSEGPFSSCIDIIGGYVAQCFMWSAVIDCYGLINCIFELIGRAVNYKAWLLLDPPIGSLNLPPALRMIWGAKDMSPLRRALPASMKS